MYSDFAAAFRTLSILPLPGKHRKPEGGALGWFGIVGFVLGAVVFGVAFAVDRLSGGWPEGAAALAVVGGAVVTGAIHLDGLADWFDAAGGARDKDRALEIMKDPRIGSFGITALVLVLGAKTVAISRLIELDLGVWIIAAFVASRTGMVLLAVWLPYARAEGGTGAPFISSARPVHLFLSLFSGTVLVLAVCGPWGLAGVAGGWLMAFLLGLWFRSRIGGVTGDTLGACCELVETTSLAAAAMLRDALTFRTGWDVWLT